MPDLKVVEKILRTLEEMFTYVCTIENIKELTVDGLQSSLMVHEQKMKRLTEFDHTFRQSVKLGDDWRFAGTRKRKPEIRDKQHCSGDHFCLLCSWPKK